MGDMNIRGMDDGLMARAKADAASRRMTLKEWVSGAMEQRLGGMGVRAIPVGHAVEREIVYEPEADEVVMKGRESLGELIRRGKVRRGV